MATTAKIEKAARRPKSLRPDLAERVVAFASIAMLVAMALALGMGWRWLGQIPTIVWLHMATIATALALTPMLLLRPRGTRWHKKVGWVWCIAMASTATASLFIGGFSDGSWSPIHILSAATLFGVYGVIRNARALNVPGHRRIIRALTIGALLVAGVFTLIPGRTLGHFLFG